MQADLGGVRAAGDHDRIGRNRLGRDALAQLDTEAGRPPHELARHRPRIGQPVLGPERTTEDVVDGDATCQLLDPFRTDPLDRHP